MIVARTRPSTVLPIMMLLWGVVTCAHAVATTSSHPVILRVLLGVLENALGPSGTVMLSSWYCPAEQAKRAVVYTSSATLGEAFGILLAGAITGGMEGSLGRRGWQWLFIIEGIGTIVWSLVCFFLVPDFPETSRWFSPRQREVAPMRVQAAGIEGYGGKLPGGRTLGKLRSIVIACKDWRTWTVFLATSVRFSLCSCRSVYRSPHHGLF